MGELTMGKVYFLALMTLSYIVGELTHFLINTTSRDVAREVHYGEQACYESPTWKREQGEQVEGLEVCSAVNSSSGAECEGLAHCKWEYSGQGIQYQVLAGPAFILVFIFSAVLLAILSDWLAARVSRTVMLACGTLTFSLACLFMGLASQYWHLVILRMLIALGLSVCRPASGALIADIFPAQYRGVANGIFSWGVYYGYGLAFVFGIYITKADILGYGWRAPYVLAALPGILLAGLLATTVQDPRLSAEGREETKEKSGRGIRQYFTTLARSFCSPSMLLLLLAAIMRHTAGYCWAFNTRLFFQHYYPDYDIGLWTFCASVFGGSFGVFAGGFFSDRLVKVLGLASRLWLLAACTLLAAPLAVGTLYFPPPGAFGCLIAYYFFAETWFAVLFTVIVEIVDPEVRSTCIALFLFIMNLFGGNLPVIVAPLRLYYGEYRSALYLVWPGFCAISGLLFLLASIPLHLRQRGGSREYNVSK